jgi:hypothetical protein
MEILFFGPFGGLIESWVSTPMPSITKHVGVLANCLAHQISHLLVDQQVLLCNFKSSKQINALLIVFVSFCCHFLES